MTEYRSPLHTCKCGVLTPFPECRFCSKEPEKVQQDAKQTHWERVRASQKLQEAEAALEVAGLDVLARETRGIRARVMA